MNVPKIEYRKRSFCYYFYEIKHIYDPVIGRNKKKIIDKLGAIAEEIFEGNKDKIDAISKKELIEFIKNH
ncbi:MAG: hypothetical protein ACFFAN_20690 [Promethearchaeota archaeon]